MKKQIEEVLPPRAERVWREAVPNDRLAHVVKDLFREFSRGMQMRLMQHSVSQGYWSFLRILWERDGLTQRELSEFAGLTEPTTYSALKSMEALGYVTRQRLPSDMRHSCVYLTPEGKALKEKLIPLAEELNSAAIQGIPPEDLAVFRRTAIAMTKNLAQDELDLNRRMPPLRKVA
ncbi:MAG: MarR family transcriptional regulator [Pseudomonadota bacterium]